MQPESIPGVDGARAKRTDSPANEISQGIPSGVKPLTEAANQVLVGAVMGERWLLARLQFGNDLVDKHLTQFDTPLIKRVDIPDRPLWED
jgi:hypothetical protein